MFIDGLVTYHHKAGVLLALVDYFYLYRIAFIHRQIKSCLVAASAILCTLTVVMPFVEAGGVGDAYLDIDLATRFSDDAEFLHAAGGEGVLGALAGFYEAGFGEDGAIGGLSTMGGRAVNVVGIVVWIASCGKAIHKDIVEDEMSIEGLYGVILATE